MFDTGPMAIVNAPAFAPVTVITEVSPTINIDLDVANRVGTAFSGNATVGLGRDGALPRFFGRLFLSGLQFLAMGPARQPAQLYYVLRLALVYLRVFLIHDLLRTLH